MRLRVKLLGGTLRDVVRESRESTEEMVERKRGKSRTASVRIASKALPWKITIVSVDLALR